MSATEQHDNRNAPTYLAHYGMHRPPFATKHEDEMYYAERTRSQRLDILLHLAQYGNELLLITGADGMGKTTMLEQFIKKAQKNWKICTVNAHSNMDEEQLLYRLCHGFNLSLDGTDLHSTIMNTKRRLEEMLISSPTVIIVVDNAHILSTSAIALLNDLAKVRNKKSGANLRIMLFAEPQIKIQFADSELEGKQKNGVRKIDLPPFDEQQTGELIRHRIKAAGLQANHTFTEAAISKIYKQSNGVPGEIVELAHRILFEMTPLKRRTKPKPMAEEKPPTTKSPMGLVALLIAVVIAAVVLMFQEEINQLYKSSVSKTPRIDKSEEKTEQPLAIPEQNLDEKAARLEAKYEELMETESTETPSEPTKTQKEEFVAPQDTTTKIPVTKPSSPQASTKGKVNLIIKINQAQWLLEQHPGHFTLQLVAGRQKTTVNNFLNQHKLPAKQLAYYRSINNKQAWHTLVYGIYPNYASAQKAIKTLPRSVRKVKPWIRQIKSIQKEIKAAATQ
ncbi:AAA family ATPase [Kaarinaea lacus]